MVSSLRDFWVFIKYAIVGTTGTLVDVGGLYLLVEFLHLPILLATGASFVLAVVNNFVLNKFWTFQNKNKNIRKQFIKFLIVAFIGLLLTLALMSLFVYVLKIPNIKVVLGQKSLLFPGYVLSKLLTSILVLLWNFLGNKYWTFQDKIRAVEHLSEYTYDLSIIVPAFNEERRLERTVRTIDSFFAQQQISREIILVDDGSKDRTHQVAKQLAAEISHTRVIHYDQNRGKGYAVKQGIEASQGRYILFTDADNSTPIEEWTKFARLLPETEVVIGSRYVKGSHVIVKQPKYRIWIGRLGNFLIRTFLVDNIRDTQCGFKAFQHAAAREIFSRMKIDRFGFDMELLVIAKLLQYNIREVPVSWYNSPDTRFRPIKDAFRTLQELIFIKLNLWGGRYH